MVSKDNNNDDDQDWYNDGTIPPTTSALDEMWSTAMNEIQKMEPEQVKSKLQPLPLARVKKIMKSEDFAMKLLERQRRLKNGETLEEPSGGDGGGDNDDNNTTTTTTGKKSVDKFFIASEAPLLLAKAAELFIRELATRAWNHADNNKRKTLQRADIHTAVGESDVFDFLIDIVPRVSVQASTTATAPPPPPPLPQVHYPPAPPIHVPPPLQLQQQQTQQPQQTLQQQQPTMDTDPGVDPAAGLTINDFTLPPPPANDNDEIQHHQQQQDDGINESQQEQENQEPSIPQLQQRQWASEGT